VVIYRCRNFSFITFSLSSKFFLLAWLPLILTSSFSLFLSSSGLVPPAWSPQLKKQKKKEKEKHRAKKHKKEKKVVVPGTDLFSLNARLLCKTISDIVSLLSFLRRKRTRNISIKGNGRRGWRSPIAAQTTLTPTVKMKIELCLLVNCFRGQSSYFQSYRIL